MQGQQEHDFVFNSLGRERRLVREQTNAEINQRWQKEIAERKGKRAARRRHKDGPHDITCDRAVWGESMGDYLSDLWRRQRKDAQKLMELEIQAAL